MKRCPPYYYQPRTINVESFLRAARILQRAGLSLQDIERATGVPMNTLYNWLKRTGPTTQYNRHSAHRFVLNGRWYRGGNSAPSAIPDFAASFRAKHCHA